MADALAQRAGTATKVEHPPGGSRPESAFSRVSAADAASARE